MILTFNKNYQTTNIMVIILRHNNSDFLQFTSIKAINSQFLRAHISLDNKIGFIETTNYSAFTIIFYKQLSLTSVVTFFINSLFFHTLGPGHSFASLHSFQSRPAPPLCPKSTPPLFPFKRKKGARGGNSPPRNIGRTIWNMP